MAMSCACPTGRLAPIGSQPELVFPWAGVLVLGTDYETYSEAVSSGLPMAIEDSLAWSRGGVHFIQALGSQLLHNHGLRLLKAGHDALAAGADGGASVVAQRFAQEAGFLTRAGENGFSPWDLLEAAASVEAVRLVAGMALATPSPWPAFNWLAGLLGVDDANELCAFLTFLAFQTNEPCSTIAGLAEAAAEDVRTWKRATAVEVLDQLGWGNAFDSYWDLVSAGEPVGTPYIVDPLREAMRRIGRSRLLEILARPSKYMNELDEHRLRAVLPPVIVYPSRTGGLVHHLNGVALENKSFAADALADVGVFGAASQLFVQAEAPYCDHLGCPHRDSGLCRQWFNPPDNETGHDNCGFVHLFTHHARQDPATVWKRLHEHA